MSVQDSQHTDNRREPNRDLDGSDRQVSSFVRSSDGHERDDVDTQKVRETTPSLITTEFWVAMGGIAALIAAFIVTDDDSLDLFRTCLLCTIVGTAYIVSRGFAKSASRTERKATVD